MRGRTMRVSEWMSPDPVALGPEDTVQEARALLRRYGIRHLPVVDRGRVVGVLSDRDVRIDEVLLAELSHVSDVKTLGGGGRAVADVMSSPAHLVAEDETMEAAARLMLSRRISALPVVDAEGALVGMVTTTDCLLATLHRSPAPS
jgi:acetoin utilization protein AcuB